MITHFSALGRCVCMGARQRVTVVKVVAHLTPGIFQATRQDQGINSCAKRINDVFVSWGGINHCSCFLACVVSQHQQRLVLSAVLNAQREYRYNRCGSAGGGKWKCQSCSNALHLAEPQVARDFSLVLGIVSVYRAVGHTCLCCCFPVRPGPCMAHCVTQRAGNQEKSILYTCN